MADFESLNSPLTHVGHVTEANWFSGRHSTSKEDLEKFDSNLLCPPALQTYSITSP